MERAAFLRSACAVSASLLLGSCASRPAVPAGLVIWPPAPYKTVRAYAYDCEAEHGTGFFQSHGRMHKGVLNAPGAVLSPGQVQRLLNAITRGRAMDRRKPCYVPHHAFVFHDADDRVVAVLEVCFSCRRFVATPEGLPRQIDYTVPWAILAELSVPVSRESGFYRELYRQKHSRPRS